MYEKLCSLLLEWCRFSNLAGDVPERIRRLELWSIGRSVDFTIAQMRGTAEYEQITEENQKVIEKIYNFLVAESSASAK